MEAKTEWVKALYHCAIKICFSKSLLNRQVSKMRLFMSWNGYPSHTIKSIFNRLKTQSTETNDSRNNDDVIKIYVRIPYAGQIGENLLKACIRKLRRFTKQNVIFTRGASKASRGRLFCQERA